MNATLGIKLSLVPNIRQQEVLGGIGDLAIGIIGRMKGHIWRETKQKGRKERGEPGGRIAIMDGKCQGPGKEMKEPVK